MFFILPKSPQSHPEFHHSLLHGGRALTIHIHVVSYPSHVSGDWLVSSYFSFIISSGRQLVIWVSKYNTTEWYKIKNFTTFKCVYVLLYLALLIMLRIPEAFGRTRVEVYVPGYSRAFFQSKTEQIQERQDETLICNLKFVFLSCFSSTNHHRSFSLFLRIGNENLLDIRTSIDMTELLTFVVCAFRCSERNNIQWETQNWVWKRYKFHTGHEKVRLTEIFFKLPWKKEIENPSNWV